MYTCNVLNDLLRVPLTMRSAGDKLSLKFVKVGNYGKPNFHAKWNSLKFASDYCFTQHRRRQKPFRGVGGRSPEKLSLGTYFFMNPVFKRISRNSILKR